MIRLEGTTIRLEDACPVEEAERLLELLQSGTATGIDLGGCRSVHTAVLQLLLAAPLPIHVPPPEALLAGLLAGRQPLKPSGRGAA
ncbi:hypothetical protein M2352_004284 [Azospirillum fermentarium]|uniref:hypothetical protein n=1 Tax=Azospirillum fermentarium TaxID=1233114 RepID=UPI002226BE6E|nr:hypothetical protein [Azospirillum fermentarium]MCW2248624.1 hypothetical protein [Azospirillum fermentarium]